jgi:hypothetical protein
MGRVHAFLVRSRRPARQLAILATLLCAPLRIAQAQTEVVAEPELATPLPWSASLDAEAGLGLVLTSETEESHSLVGGLTRLRVGYWQIGALAEYASFGASAGDSRAVHVAGLLGAFLPFYNWADIEATLGLGYRSYVNTSTIYGPGGYQKAMPTLDVRAGVSDRMGDVMGGRLGAQLFASIDLSPSDVPWTILSKDQRTVDRTGSRRVGGVALGMLMTIGFDVGPCYERPKPHPLPQPPSSPPAVW